jgi:glycosyltransferase involved in cell wall biosynthesis
MMTKINQHIERMFSKGALVFARLFFPYIFLSLLNSSKSLPQSSKSVFCTLDDEFLFRDDDGHGRYAFWLLYIFSQMGYSVYFYRPVNFIGFKRLGYCGRYIYSLKNLKIIDKVPENTSDMIYMFDEPRDELINKSWKKLVYVNIVRPAHFKFGEVIEIPFSMHPMQYHTRQTDKIQDLRKTERKLRIFFGGNTTKEAYQSKSVPQYGQLNRYEATESISNSIAQTQVITSLNDFHDAIKRADGFLNKFILLRAEQSGQLKTEEWLATIAKSQFFMCFSGTTRPICHNAVEAMAVGTIPIISYQDWFFPALEHMNNAIVYSGKEDLISKIRQVLEMPHEQVREMSKRVAEYYDKYLAPVYFQERFEKDTAKICTLMLFPRVILSEKQEARVKFIKDGISRYLAGANITTGV